MSLAVSLGQFCVLGRHDSLEGDVHRRFESVRVTARCCHSL